MSSRRISSEEGQQCSPKHHKRHGDQVIFSKPPPLSPHAPCHTKRRVVRNRIKFSALASLSVWLFSWQGVSLQFVRWAR